MREGGVVVLVVASALFYTTMVAAAAASAKEKSADDEDDSMPEVVFNNYHHKVMGVLAKTEWLNKSREYVMSRPDPSLLLGPEDFDVIKKLFEEVVSDEQEGKSIQAALNAVKKKEIDIIRKRIIPRRKYLKKGFKEPNYLNFNKLKFSGEDIALLFTAIQDHKTKWQALRRKDRKLFEMEKRFQEKQVLRHLNNDRERKQEIERREKEKAEQANKELKHPLSKDQIEDVWENQDNLPKDEFDPKTFFALHDLDGNGLLDTREVELVLKSEYEKSFTDKDKPEVKEERRQEMLRMREHIYNSVDKNKDMMIDLAEFIGTLETEKEEKWDEQSEDYDYDEDDFKEFENEKIDEIRDKFAQGEKPDGYGFEDVPLLDGNFVNATHIIVDGTIVRADDSARSDRERKFKEYEMRKKFDQEQEIQHAKDSEERVRIEREISRHKDRQIHMHDPLSLQQLEKVWEVQDHKDPKDFNDTQFFHLHDINGDGGLDAQELRLLLITEIQSTYKARGQEYDEVEMSEELERMREKTLERADTNRDMKIDLQEFLTMVEKTRENKKQRKKDKYWEEMEERSTFTEGEYRKFRDQHVQDIRKMIAEGHIPENYNYTDVPQLTGYFVNTTHVQKGGVVINLHEQEATEKYKDFKRFLMLHRYFLEEELSKKLTPEEHKKQLDQFAERKRQRKERLGKVNAPLSEKQERETWKEEDHMDDDDFDLERYFNLHDTDRDGLWSKTETIASLMHELDKMYDPKDEGVKEEREAKLQEWLTFVLKQGDRNRDNYLDLEEMRRMSEQKPEAEMQREEEELDYTDDEFEEFRKEQGRQKGHY